MVLKSLVITAFFSIRLLASITIEYPPSAVVVSSNSIVLHIHSSTNQAFILIHDRLLPLRRGMQYVPIPIQRGENNVTIHILDHNKVFQAQFSRQFTVYYFPPILDCLSMETYLIVSTLLDAHGISMVSNQRLYPNKPITKKDMYALVSFFEQMNAPVTTRDYFPRYTDLYPYPQYQTLFMSAPHVFEKNDRRRFYPEAYVTRQEFMNVLLTKLNVAEQISTDYIVDNQLKIPTSLHQYVPSDWDGSLTLVTKQDVMTALLKIRAFRHPAISPVPIPPIPYDSHQTNAPIMTRIIGMQKRLFRRIFKENLADDGASKKIHFSTSDGGNTDPIILPEPVILNSQPRTPEPAVLSQTLEKNDAPHQREQVYVVQSGDSMPKISKKFYNNYGYWKELARYNQIPIKKRIINNNEQFLVAIFPGNKLKIPPLTVLAVSDSGYE